jgi:hypothetical protein
MKDPQIGNPRVRPEKVILKSWRYHVRREAAEGVECLMSIETASTDHAMMSRGEIGSELSEAGSAEQECNETGTINHERENGDVAGAFDGETEGPSCDKFDGDCPSRRRAASVEHAGSSIVEFSLLNRRC